MAPSHRPTPTSALVALISVVALVAVVVALGLSDTSPTASKTTTTSSIDFSAEGSVQIDRADAADAWTRLVDPPVALEDPELIDAGDHILVSGRTADDPGDVVVLAYRPGRWDTIDPASADIDRGRNDPDQLESGLLAAAPVDPGCPTTIVSPTEVVIAVACDSVAAWFASADRWVTLAVPSAADGWSGDCTPTTLGSRPRRMVVWCATGDGPTFWELDARIARVDRILRPGDGPRETVPNPAIDTRRDFTLSSVGGSLVLACSTEDGPACGSGWSYDPTSGEFSQFDTLAAGASGVTTLWLDEREVAVRGLTSAYDGFSVEWRTTQRSPRTGRSTIATWTGDVVVFLGSPTEASVTGTLYDPDTDTWDNMPSAPIAPAIAPVVAWSGSEVLVVGGRTYTDGGITSSRDGAAYSPSENRWRLLPNVPAEASAAAVGGFAGGRLIVLGPGPDADVVGFAYEPESDRWRTMAVPDVDAPRPRLEQALATSHFGELALLLPPASALGTMIAFYDPASDTWRYREGTAHAPISDDFVSGARSDGRRYVAYRSEAGTEIVYDDATP